MWSSEVTGYGAVPGSLLCRQANWDNRCFHFTCLAALHPQKRCRGWEKALDGPSLFPSSFLSMPASLGQSPETLLSVAGRWQLSRSDRGRGSI